MKKYILIMCLVLLPCYAMADSDATPVAIAKSTKKLEPKKAPTKKVEPAKKAAAKKKLAEPKTVDEAISTGKQIAELAKTKQWFAMSAGVIWLFMFLFKLGRKKVSFMKKIPKRALWVMVPVLSVAAMVLTKLQTDLSWSAAVTVLSSGPSVAFLNDLLKRGILGKEPSPVNGTDNASE
jgi:hypothetical protein